MGGLEVNERGAIAGNLGGPGETSKRLGGNGFLEGKKPAGKKRTKNRSFSVEARNGGRGEPCQERMRESRLSTHKRDPRYGRGSGRSLRSESNGEGSPDVRRALGGRGGKIKKGGRWNLCKVKKATCPLAGWGHGGGRPPRTRRG